MEDEFVVPVVVSNGHDVAEAKDRITFRYRQRSAGAAQRARQAAAAFPGGVLTLHPTSPRVEERILRLRVTPPVPGVQRARIVIPRGEKKDPAVLDAEVKASGEVIANEDIRFADDKWHPADFSAVDGKAIDNVKVKLVLPSGGTLEFQVDGMLVIKK
jgi:hypothetical protein